MLSTLARGLRGGDHQTYVLIFVACEFEDDAMGLNLAFYVSELEERGPVLLVHPRPSFWLLAVEYEGTRVLYEWKRRRTGVMCATATSEGEFDQEENFSEDLRTGICTR